MFTYRQPGSPAMSPNERLLSRDVSATLVPAGDAINLPAGTRVSITHRLGGNFTVVCDYGMFRINGTDADAIGEKTAAAAPAAEAPAPAAAGPPDEALLRETLKTVFDPEIPVNIVDLGLVYGLEIKDLGEQRYGVEMKMTLTAPGCGMGPAIAEDAKGKILLVPGVSDADVRITWDPPWNQSMISEEGKMKLGLV
jgi:probable FeS assembly SUF system protein SufT